MIIDLHEILVAIYRLIRDKYQEKIDAAFDDASRQIGFVVTTTIPVDVEIGKDRKITHVTVAADNLKGTLFEKITSAVGTTDAIGGKAGAGKYRLYLLWYPALKLRLRTDFMEPAHHTAWQEPAHPTLGGLFSSLRSELASRFVGRVPIAGEPAHWFDPGFAIAAEEAVVIHAIDEVYPELRLAERVSVGRQAARALGPGVREPAHFRPNVREDLQQLVKALDSAKPEFVNELTALLRRHGY
jgi:hypothetical protein